MGQVSSPQVPPSLILSPVDRLIAANAGGGISPLATHIILLGENAGANLGALSCIIAIGSGALDAGLVDPNASGTIGIGCNAGSSLLGTLGVGPDVLIGVNAGRDSVLLGSSVIVGANAFDSYALGSSSGLVLIGANVFRGQNNDRNTSFTVAIGVGIGSNAVGIGLSNNVLIGAGVLVNIPLAAGNVNQQITAIGAFALNSISVVGGGASGVYIGYNCANSKAGGANETLIGSSIVTTNGSSNVAVGSNIVVNDAIACVQIGDTITGARGNGSIIIGNRAGDGETVTTQANRLIIENNSGGHNCVLYGDLAAGNLIVGNSVSGTNRDMAGTNTLKIINGTPGGPAPVGGGRFWVSAGQLHWIDAGTNDYALTPSASLGNFTVATLPLAPPLGSKAYATDALAPAFGAAVAGGGAIFIPVFFNGVAWTVG